MWYLCQLLSLQCVDLDYVILTFAFDTKVYPQDTDAHAQETSGVNNTQTPPISLLP